ncbi:MAG: DUF885 domain-containing protein [Candidatus Limnocylindrales bacterium]
MGEVSHAAEGGTAADAVNALSDRFWEGILDLSPITATVLGYEKGADRLDDPGPAGRDRARALFRETLATADSIAVRAGATGGLPTEERITLDILRVVCDIELEQQAQRFDRLKVVDQMDGPQTILPQLASFQPTGTPEQLEAFIARLADYPRFMAANAEVAREGLAGGVTAARIVTERVIGQLERLLAIPVEESPIVGAITFARPADRERVVEAVGKYVLPSDRHFLGTLLGKYREASRGEPGLWSVPHGDELYLTQIRAWTSLAIDAGELHRSGLDELASIEEERRAIARDLGFGDDTKAARAALKSDPAAVPASIDELLDRARGQIERALAAAPDYFGNLPHAGCSVRAVEPYKEADAPAAYYFPPAVDGSRPGVFYVNTYDLPSRSYVGLASTSFHEAVPGHHFQIALQNEHPSLDAFRRMGSRMAGMAYVEGWGLYSERLADEMGLYLNRAERFGMLDGQAWRAARLVVDTGIHAFHWQQQRSIDQLLEAGLSETDALIETDRYICLPAQALTYKVGQREIDRLRKEASAALGSVFDIRAFHDAVLGHGTLPLATLAKELPGWLGIAG